MKVSFTGHRPNKLGGYQNNPISDYVKEKLTEKIEKCILDGVDNFISGMAIGVDTWAAEIVLQLKEKYSHIKLEAAIPFKGQEGKWPDFSQDIYNNILKKCDKITIVCEGTYAAWKMQKRNEYMVDNSDLVIAVWDGTTGGTKNCIKYARSQSKKVIWINPNDKE